MNHQANHYDSGFELSFLTARMILGILFTMAGFWKVFTLGADMHSARFFVDGYSDTWIPVWALISLGWIIPFWELLAGVMLLLGYRLKEVLFSLSVLLMITTYGHALKEPLFDVTGHTFSRLALIIFLLMLLPHADRLSVDGWRNRK